MPKKPVHVPICDYEPEQLAALRYIGKTHDGIYGWHFDTNPLHLEIGDAADYEKWRKVAGRIPALDAAQLYLVSDAELSRLHLIMSDLVMVSGNRRGSDLLADGRRIIEAIRERAV